MGLMWGGGFWKLLGLGSLGWAESGGEMFWRRDQAAFKASFVPVCMADGRGRGRELSQAGPSGR